MFGMFAAIGKQVKGEVDKRKQAAQGMQQGMMSHAQSQSQGMLGKLSTNYKQIPSYQDFTNFK